MSDELFDRNGMVIKMVFSGVSYEETGKKFGISKQRVYQIVKRLCKPLYQDNYLTISQFSRRYEMPLSRVHYLIKTGGVKTEKIGRINYIKVS